ncbi:hypothetical protein HU200_067603 [Digitaria exilis]|uniref:Protein kinase domain-containing protein n=1 Tax=Digitaria exilis TaxID=1010633 RepID=A0A835DSR4_9POAL|nr:hypothetical protein HU200_067603 [Digitaria exilis]
MEPKLADFGLSKLVNKDQQTEVTQNPLGTMGYLPPEFIEGTVVSNKFDIFSLGVVMIRIITGYEGYHKKSQTSSQEFIEFVRNVHDNWRNRLQAKLGYSSLEADCHQVRRCVEIALDCIQADRHERPTIGVIIRWLNQLEHTVDKMALCLTQQLKYGPSEMVRQALQIFFHVVIGNKHYILIPAPVEIFVNLFSSLHFFF